MLTREKENYPAIWDTFPLARYAFLLVASAFGERAALPF